MKEINEILQTGILSGFRGYAEYHLGGKYVQLLEQAFRDYFGVKYAIALNSATSALHAALIACGVGQGDEVIVSPYSFSASASCVLMVGAKPVFADIEDETFCIDTQEARKLITPKTKAIIPVHLCGHPADMDGIIEVVNNEYKNTYWKNYKIEEYKNRLSSGTTFATPIKIIEDAAQAITAEWYGQKVGRIGVCGIFSFNQSKQISTGEGGMLITDDADIARKVRAVRNHGEVSDPDLKIVGYNYRLLEIPAAQALAQFKDIDKNINTRIKLATYLTERLSQIEGITPPVVRENCKHSYYTYAVKINPDIIGVDKETLCQRLGEREVYFGTYVKPLHLLPIYEQFGYKEGDCPVAERMWKRELILTDIIRPEKTFKDMDKIYEAFRLAIN